MGIPNWLQKWLDRNAIRLRGLEELVFQGQHVVERPLRKLGKVDVVVGTFTRTPGREEKVDFSDTYFVAGQMLLVNSASTITSVQDLVDKVVVVVKTSTAVSSVGTLIPTQRVRLVDDYPAALIALDRREADALLTDDTILQGLLAQFPGKYKLLGDRLTDELEDSIARFNDGYQIKRYSAHYFRANHNLSPKEEKYQRALPGFRATPTFAYQEWDGKRRWQHRKIGSLPFYEKAY